MEDKATVISKKPPRMPNDYARAEVATENAFRTLIQVAKEVGLEPAPVMGLVYLPEQKLTEDFKEACRAILMKLTPAASHERDGDGLEIWKGEYGSPGFDTQE